MTFERRDTPSLEAWCHDQRRCFDALRVEEGVFVRIEAPKEWKKDDGKLQFAQPKEFPMSYIAEQIQAPRGKLHLEPDCIDWSGGEGVHEILSQIAARGTLHPVSFKTLEQLSLRAVFLDPILQRSLVLPGVIARFRDKTVYPVIEPLLSSVQIARRALVFLSATELVERAKSHPTAFFFAHKKPLPREQSI